jgi:hypothetical protein
MNQALYAHRNNTRKMKKKKETKTICDHEATTTKDSSRDSAHRK